MQAFVDLLHQDQPYDSLTGVCDGVRSNQVLNVGDKDILHTAVVFVVSD